MISPAISPMVDHTEVFILGEGKGRAKKGRPDGGLPFGFCDKV
jgi:hypothetical protein